MSNRNRTAGHNWERECQKILLPLFPKTLTSRNESRTLDNLKVDLTHTDPYYFQCKTTANKLDYHTLLNEMPQDEHINVLLHRLTKKVNTRFIKQDDYVILKMDDFIEILTKLKNNGAKENNNTNNN